MTAPVQTGGRPLLAAWSLLVGLSLVSRPLESPDLWWDLARGRELQTAFTFHPSQNLLALDQASEAAWLGGSFLYKVWSGGGIYALAAMPLLVTFLIWGELFHRVTAARQVFSVIGIFPLTILATRADLEPTSRLWDLMCLGCLWLILQSRGSSKSILLWLAVLFFAWANHGPVPIWGLLLVALWPGPLSGRVSALVVSLLAGMVTPRGPLTWLDSTILFAPTAFVPESVLEARWQSILGGGWNPALAAAGVLWIIAAVSLARRRSIAGIAMLAVPLVAMLLSQTNIAPAALWTAFTWRTLTRDDAEPTQTAHRGWVRPIVALVTALAVVDACGMLSPGSSTMGWGVSQSIDPRLLEISDMIPGNDRAVAWAADSRSAGVAAWAKTRTKLVDHPTRALLGGRSATHAAVRRDLSWAHRSRYRLDDGSWGGWGRPFADWKVEVLFVPAETGDLHRGLLETPWKLIKLDSPTVPYVSAENPRFDRAVVDVMLQQGFVESGAWQPSIDVYDPHGWRVEASNVLGLGPSAAPAIRQSRFFRAVKLPMAALRALGPVRMGGGTAAVREEFLNCQEAAALQESNETGMVSLFRRLALDVPGIIESESEHWRRGRDLYRSGRIAEAVEALAGGGSDEAYGRGLMLLELGKVEEARKAFESALLGDNAALKIAARYWLNQMSPGNKGSTAFLRDLSVPDAAADQRCPNGAEQQSPGQRPGKAKAMPLEALKGRNHLRTSTIACDAPAGLGRCTVATSQGVALG